MDCYLFDSKPLSVQTNSEYCRIVKWNLRNKIKWRSNKNTLTVQEENAFRS